MFILHLFSFKVLGDKFKVICDLEGLFKGLIMQE